MLKLREAALRDETFLFDVYASTRMEEVTGWGWDEQTTRRFLSMQWTAQKQSYSAQYPNLAEQIVLVSGVKAGRLATAFTTQALVLADISLMPQYRGQGYGRELIHTVQREAAEARLPVRLSVGIGNPAKRLYERAGFYVTNSDDMRDQMIWQPDKKGANERKG